MRGERAKKEARTYIIEVDVERLDVSGIQPGFLSHGLAVLRYPALYPLVHGICIYWEIVDQALVKVDKIVRERWLVERVLRRRQD